jgi:hypothetical protein
MKIYKIILTVLLCVAIMQSACAERILSISFTADRNGSVELKTLKASEGKSTIYVAPGDYSLVITGEDNRSVLLQESLDITFENGQNQSVVFLREPYDPDMRRLFLYKDSKQIFYSDIAFCNRNGVCDYYENSMTCPSDCPAGKNDSSTSGLFAPDKKEDSQNMGCVLLVFIVVLMIAAFIFYRKKQAQKIAKQREEFIRWKEEQEFLKNTGKPSS